MYNNLPAPNKSGSSSDATLKSFQYYNDVPIELNQNTLTAMIGFLESRNFTTESAEVIALTIMVQATREKYNPMSLIESMKTLNETELSTIVAEVLNFNRFKSSFLGSKQAVAPVDNVRRNILP
jgi:Glu-tRNA(Gln) amidotransferase subunit E-like FAD-binding protein